MRALSTRCTQLENQVKKLEQQMADMVSSENNFYEACDFHLSPNLSLVVKNYVRNCKKNHKVYAIQNSLSNWLLLFIFLAPVHINF